jgi:folate-dependent phosphoribosylglycinamide formyltransferase PurN
MKKIIVFGYSFPHFKTQQGLFNLITEGFKPSLVLAQPYKNLNLKHSYVRVAPRHSYILNAKHICKSFGIEYREVEHDSLSAASILNQFNPDIGIILGARILKRHIIEQFSIGILNLHPGLIPENRGLDNIKWGIIQSIPQGATAHLITQKIDHGPIIAREQITLEEGDSLIDIYIKVQELELKLMVESCRKLLSNKHQIFVTPDSEGVYYKPVPEELDLKVSSMLPDYIKKNHAKN